MLRVVVQRRVPQPVRADRGLKDDAAVAHISADHFKRAQPELHSTCRRPGDPQRPHGGRQLDRLGEFRVGCEVLVGPLAALAGASAVLPTTC